MARFSAILVLSLVMLCLAAPALSQAPASSTDRQALPPDAPTHDQVMTMLDLLQMRRNLQQLMSGMVAAMKDGAERGLRSKNPNPTPKQLEAIHAVIEEAFKDMPIDEMLEAIVPVYQRHFSKTDLDEVIRFFSSPVGQKMLREQPQMMQEGMKAGQEVAKKHFDEMMARIDRRVDAILSADEQNSPAKKQ